ncbi:MAG: hypothetical protein J0M02_06365 [Planctomycetes bacterium]|nr:hypothetical protein [Planctomycetota bacterium]
MVKVAIALLTAVALLLVVQIIDRSREPAQLKAVLDASERAASAQERMLLELKSLREELARRPAAAPTAAATASTDAGGRRDGVPREGGNFLLAPDTSHFDPAKVGGRLVEFERPPQSLNPLLENLASASAARGYMNDGLCDSHPAHPDLWYEGLAESVVIADGWRRFTFRIRPGVVWHRPAMARDGRHAWLDRDVELTAKDFAFAIDLIRNGDVDCPHLKGYYENVASARALDDRTFELVWKESEYTNIDGSLGLTPLPSHIYGRYEDGSEIPPEKLGAVFNKHWFDEAHQFVGTGMYMLESFEPGKSLELLRNPRYWSKGLHVDRMAWDGSVVQPDAQLTAFKNGQVHFQGLLPAQYKSEILDGRENRFAKPVANDPTAGRTGAFGWERVRGTSYAYIGWNMRRPIFADQRVRQALTLAFPKQRIIDEVFLGLGRPQYGPIHPDSPYAATDLPRFDFDPAVARQRLAEAGWKDSDGDGWLDREIAGQRTPLRFRIAYYAAGTLWQNILAIYRDNLKPLGIDMTPDPIEDTEWERRMDNKDFDGMCAGWQMDLDADFVQLWHSKGADEPKSSNHCGFRDQRVDELSLQLRRTFDRDERIRIAREVQRLIAEAQPYVFIRSGEGIFAWQNGRSGPADRRDLLGGVVTGFERLHPLRNRTRLYWTIDRAP